MRIRFIFASYVMYMEAHAILFQKYDDTEIASVYKYSKDEEPLICVFDNEEQKNMVEQQIISGVDLIDFKDMHLVSSTDFNKIKREFIRRYKK